MRPILGGSECHPLRGVDTLVLEPVVEGVDIDQHAAPYPHQDLIEAVMAGIEDQPPKAAFSDDWLGLLATLGK